MIKWFLILILIPSVLMAQVRQDIIIAPTSQRSAASAFAYAPHIISKCSGSLAGGAQGQFAGISFSGSYKDEFCERAELVKLAIAMGHDDIADDLFFEFPMIKDLDKEEEPKKVCDYPTKCTRLGR